MHDEIHEHYQHLVFNLCSENHVNVAVGQKKALVVQESKGSLSINISSDSQETESNWCDIALPVIEVYSSSSEARKNFGATYIFASRPVTRGGCKRR